MSDQVKKSPVHRRAASKEDLERAQKVTDEFWNALSPVMGKYLKRADETEDFQEAAAILRAIHSALAYELGIVEQSVMELYVETAMAHGEKDPEGRSFTRREAAETFAQLLTTDRAHSMAEGRKHFRTRHGHGAKEGPTLITGEGDMDEVVREHDRNKVN